MLKKMIKNSMTFVLKYYDQENHNGYLAIYDNKSNVKRYFGEIKNDRITGVGKEYDSSGKLLYKGQFLNKKKNGAGTSFYPNREKCYEGLWEDDLQNGQGKYYDSTGELVYEGEVIHGLIGVSVEKQEFLLGLDPFGNSDSFIYIGQMKDGERNGFGKMSTHFTSVAFHENQQDVSEKYYIGQWQNDVPHGKGKLFIDRILSYEGDFTNGDFMGSGKMFENGRIRFEGNIICSTTGASNVIHDDYDGIFIQTDEHYDSDKIPVWIWPQWKGLIHMGNGKFYTESGKLWFEGSLHQNNR